MNYSSTNDTNRLRTGALVSLLLVVPLGMGTKIYTGPLSEWIRGSLGGVLYEVFWCLVGLGLKPRAGTLRITLTVCAVTCCLEFLQLWHPTLLEAVRATLIGRSLIGDMFDWSDFGGYFIGSAIGWAWINTLQTRLLKAVFQTGDPART